MECFFLHKKDKVILGKFWTANGGVPRKRIERETEHVASLARCESTKAGRRKAIFVDPEGVPIGKQRFYETFHGHAMTRDILPLTRQGWFVEMHCMRPWMQPVGKNLTLNKALPLTPSSVPKPKRLMDWLNSKGEKLTHELMTLLILSEAQQYLKEHKDEVL